MRLGCADGQPDAAHSHRGRHRGLRPGGIRCAGHVQRAGELTGLVDDERWLYGDPLMDFVGLALFRRIEDEPEHPFVAGYRSAQEGAQRSDFRLFDHGERTRLALCRLHLYLLMTIEMPSRGMTPATHAGRIERLARLLDIELTDLEAA